MFKKILLPIDPPEPEMSKQAIDRAQALAKAFDGEPRLVNVQSLVPVAFIDYIKEDFTAQILRGIEQEISTLVAKIDHPLERVSTAVLFGPVHHRILEEAEAWNADVIVLCSHQPGMDRFLIGSNASAIVRQAKCSVLVVRR